MLRKHAAKFGRQWDRYLSSVLWAYRNTPHESTKEKPSFLLFGIDCRTSTEAASLPPTTGEPVDLSDYRQELTQSLSAAQKLAVSNIRDAQRRYKEQYDKQSRSVRHKIGEWVLVCFPHEESGKMRKLLHPWHGPYRTIERRDPDLMVVKVYFPEDGPIQIHQSRVSSCPPKFTAGFYWYGGNKKSEGRIPTWVQKLMLGHADEQRSDDALPTELPAGFSEHADDGTEKLDNCSDPNLPQLTPIATLKRYSLRDRSREVHHPSCFM